MRKRRTTKPASGSPRPAVVPGVAVAASGVADSGSPPRIRGFVVTMRVRVSVDQRLLDDVLTEEWREMFYRLTSEKAIASHLAYNLVQDRRLSSLDGFADQPEDRARVEEIFVEEDEDDVEEVEEPRRRKERARRAKR